MNSYDYLREYYIYCKLEFNTSDFIQCQKGWREDRIRNWHGIWVITKGKMHIKYRDEEYVLKKHDLFIFSKDYRYIATALNDNTEFLFINFGLNMNMYNEQKHLRLFSDGLARYENMKAEIDSLIAKAKSVYESQSPFSRFLYKSMAYEILAHFFEKSRYDQDYDSLFFESTKISSVIAYIHQHIDERITEDELAKFANVSRKTLYNQFMKIRGITPRKYVWNTKMGHAVNLISSGKYSLKEVASMVGYDDYQTFANVFKKWTGVSPSKYNK